MLPMYSSVESIVGRGWEAARPGRCGPGRTVEAAERGSVYCGGGCGWWRLVPVLAASPTLSGLAIVPPMAGVRARSPAPPRTAAHRPHQHCLR